MMKIISAILAASLLTAEGASAKKSAIKNTAPTISDIAAQSINPGSSTGALAFTISDAQTAASSLKLSARSSNTKLVSSSKIKFGGRGANRTVTVTPTRGQTGTTTIKVTVSDGRLSASDTFLLNVNANTAPTISDIAAQTINQGSSTSALAFTVGDAQTAAGSLNVSASSSNTTLVPNANIVFGGSGANRTVTVTPASGQIGTATITVTVSDGSLSTDKWFLLDVNIDPNAPAIMALIPAGTFEMGESNHPLVTLDAFYIGKHEVTKAEWDRVRNWGNSGNYNLPEGSGMANNHPVHSITWYDMVEWCNARSEKEGLTPVYYTDDAQTKIYRGGVVNLTDARVRWEANGYRLPTEAEWEKAARGGLSRKRFPWGDTIDHSQANFLIYYFDYYRGESAVEYHPSALGYYKTTPVGILQANGYGLYDMAGNVAERCWDWNASPFWSYGSWTVTNWRGPSSGTSKVYRGGCSLDFADDCGVARRAGYHPNNQLGQNNETLGFRVARSLDPAEFAYVAKGTLPSSSELSGQSVSSFYIAKTETTWGQWQSVRAYAAANGYDIGSAGAGNGNDYPVTDVTWYQVVKWCNARSEMEGLTPVYMINNLIYKTGEIEPTLNAMANGYRLPTDAQWEFAARGGASTKNYEYSGSIYMDEVAWYNNNSGNATRIVGTKKANELGVYDMSGNVWEWCESWYPDGSIPSAYRTSRGGSWYLNGSNCRVAYRYYMDPSISLNDFGFRVVRSP